jgi:hypothetical protein
MGWRPRHDRLVAIPTRIDAPMDTPTLRVCIEHVLVSASRAGDVLALDGPRH